MKHLVTLSVHSQNRLSAHYRCGESFCRKYMLFFTYICLFLSFSLRHWRDLSWGCRSLIVVCCLLVALWAVTSMTRSNQIHIHLSDPQTDGMNTNIDANEEK